MSDDELQLLHDTLAAHRSMVLAAKQVDDDVDLEGALTVHAGLGNLISRWSEFSVGEQREIIRTLEYLVNPDDDQPDLGGPDGFRDDLAELRRLQGFLGYV